MYPFALAVSELAKVSASTAEVVSAEFDDEEPPSSAHDEMNVDNEIVASINPAIFPNDFIKNLLIVNRAVRKTDVSEHI